MTETETIQILRLDTGEVVRNIADLKKNIHDLKAALDDENLSWEQQQAILKALSLNQAALKTAMYATNTSLEEVAASASAANVKFDEQNQLIKDGTNSYNALVKKMAELTAEFRNTGNEARRSELGEQIRQINDELKRMDADRGNFQRNVGNYKSAADGFAEVLRAFPPTLGKTATEVKNIGTSLQLVGKQPILGIIGLLAPLIMKIADGLKENETALGAIDKLMEALKPVADFFAGVLEKIAGLLSKAVDWVLELGENSGIEFKKIVAGVVGVGNSILQFLLTPIRNTIDGAKALGNVFQQVFKGQFKEAAQTAKQAVKDIGENIKKGFDFKGNFELGKQIGEQFADGLKSTTKKAGEAARAVVEEVDKEMEAAIQRMFRRFEAALKGREQYDNWLAQEAQAAAAELEAIYQADVDAVQEMLNAQLNAEWEALQQEKKIKEQRMAIFMAYTTAVADVAGALADIYEADADADEEAAKKAKGLRIASTILSTINGAVSAYTSTWSAAELPLSAKMVLAPVNAAAVLAAGYAQIKQMNAVKVGDSSGGSVVAAPAFQPAISQVRNITGASEEERLNRMAADNRVYIVYSDLEIAQHGQRVKVRETEF